MASKKKKRTRQTADYLLSVRKLKKLVPSLKKFENRQRLKKSEKATIRRREKQLKNIPFLVPVTETEAKKLGRKKLFLPGVRAIQLRNVSETAKIKIKKGGELEVVDNDQRWIYWSLDKEIVRSRRKMREAGEQAFNKQFPIEKVSALSELAFRQYRVQQVNLWAHAGIVGDNFQDVGSFIRWVNEKWQQGRYVSSQEGSYYNVSDPGRWVNGIAILIENPEYTRKRRELAKAAKNKKLV